MEIRQTLINSNRHTLNEIFEQKEFITQGEIIVGDVHGSINQCLTPLIKANFIEHVGLDDCVLKYDIVNPKSRKSNAKVIYLGDIFNRGFINIDFQLFYLIIQVQFVYQTEVILCLGNHELMMYKCIKTGNIENSFDDNNVSYMFGLYDSEIIKIDLIDEFTKYIRDNGIVVYYNPVLNSVYSHTVMNFYSLLVINELINSENGTLKIKVNNVDLSFYYQNTVIKNKYSSDVVLKLGLYTRIGNNEFRLLYSDLTDDNLDIVQSGDENPTIHKNIGPKMIYNHLIEYTGPKISISDTESTVKLINALFKRLVHENYYGVSYEYIADTLFWNRNFSDKNLAFPNVSHFVGHDVSTSYMYKLDPNITAEKLFKLDKKHSLCNKNVFRCDFSVLNEPDSLNTFFEKAYTMSNSKHELVLDYTIGRKIKFDKLFSMSLLFINNQDGVTSFAHYTDELFTC